ncbi:uncharacterized protein LOC135942591 isoform X1 [Cloeon dipterum]|uniref:uncharacterized protein LOC135942591 isoform X1 n=2 Tax=Cloeon dipterum TaxID=197152 RepID=UPI00321FC220
MLIKSERAIPLRAQQLPRPNSVNRDWLANMSESDQRKVSNPLLGANCRSEAAMSDNTFVAYYHGGEIGKQKNGSVKMRGARRVIAFCLLTAAIPMTLVILPLYLRNSVFAQKFYSYHESDLATVEEGISTIFCQGQIIRAEKGRFSAHQLIGEPGISEERRTMVLERKMSIPDDRLEYWGFHLLPKSFLTIKVCAGSPGARLLVVRGEKNLELCGLLQPPASAEVAKPPLVDNGEITFEEHHEEAAARDQDEEENTAAEVTDDPLEENSTAPEHRHRHERSRMNKVKRDSPLEQPTTMRTKFKHMSEVAHFEGAIEHGGNTNWNVTEPEDGGSSVSSFESGLLTCFQGKTLFQRGFEASGKLCDEDVWTGSMVLSQTVRTQGHYYYVFYSDNDLDINHIKALFQINATKPDFSLASHSCYNSTECKFSRSFFGGDGTVFLEAESELEVESTCEPRIAVYLMFPVCAMVFVLIFGLL